jgi:16S rRNA G966 N2-methylase RsmD
MLHVATWLTESIRRRGVVRTAQVAASVVADTSFDVRYGTQTRGLIPNAKLDIPVWHRSSATNYQPAKAAPLLKLLRQVDPDTGGTFIDFGSGKGRAMLVAALHGFTRIVGVDCSHELCELARRNISTFVDRTESQASFEVVECDAATFAIAPEADVFFLYNPFNGDVLNRVLQNIDASFAAIDRRAWLIYNTPIHGDAIHETGLFSTRTASTIDGVEFEVFER